MGAASDEYSCEFGSAKYYALCAVGGALSCGLTHTAVTPLDLVKCRLQVNKEKYKSLGNGFKLTVKESGASGLFLGWAPTAIGYSMQGICKFGFYGSSRISTLELLEKKTPSFTERHFIWQLLLLPSSLLISLFLPWSQSRCEFRPAPLEHSQPHLEKERLRFTPQKVSMAFTNHWFLCGDVKSHIP